ncbi:hypothetical protein ACQZV8_01450 [Magnetococcales bacterium HHB-1]
MIRWLMLLGTLLLAFMAILFVELNQQRVFLAIPGGPFGATIKIKIALVELLFLVMGIGIFFGAAGGELRRWHCSQQKEQLLCKNRELEKELSNLRNLPLNDDASL